MYFGQHYESSVLKANETKQDVIQIKNENGITSSIPIERANHLLEKYHRTLKKKTLLAASSDPNAKTALVLATETAEVAAKTVPPKS